MIRGLKNGTVDSNDIPAIRIVEKDGLIYTLDNRRLKVFQDAGLPVNYQKLEAVMDLVVLQPWILLEFMANN